MTVRAIYKDGVFQPTDAVTLPEPCLVEFEPRLVAEGEAVRPPEITDASQKAQLLRLVAERMRQNPIPADAPRLTREQLHARR